MRQQAYEVLDGLIKSNNKMDTNEELVNLCDVDMYDIIDFGTIAFKTYFKYFEDIELDINKIYTINWTANDSPDAEQMLDSAMPILKIKFENYNNDIYKYSYSTCVFMETLTDVMEINILYAPSMKILVLSISFQGILNKVNNNLFLLKSDVISNKNIGDSIRETFEGHINLNKPIIISDTIENRLVINNYAYFTHYNSIVGHNDTTITSIIFTDNFMINIKIEEEHDDSPEGFITFTAEFLENNLISQ